MTKLAADESEDQEPRVETIRERKIFAFIRGQHKPVPRGFVLNGTANERQ
jgi:hypothetical protein